MDSNNSLIERGFKYLARDEGGALFAYKYKPEKRMLVWVVSEDAEDSEHPHYTQVNDGLGVYDTIQWEDKEPTEIETLKSAVSQPFVNPIEFGGLSIHTREGGGMAIFKTEEPNSRIYTTVTDSVNHPAHYNVGGTETIDVIRAVLTPEEYRGYLKGNVLEYRERALYKHETPDEDHAKAKVYWELLQEAEGERIFE